MTDPRLAGATGGGLGRMPKSRPWKVLASITSDRYRPVGALAPGGPVASLAIKVPAHGDQEHLDVSGAGNVVAGRGGGERFGARGQHRCDPCRLGSPLIVAARCAIAVSRGTAEAGTSAPAAAAERPQPAAASTDASAAAPASGASARAVRRVVRSGCIASPVPLPVGRSPHPDGCLPRRIARSATVVSGTRHAPPPAPNQAALGSPRAHGR